MNKPYILYTALTEAVDHYNERNNYTRGHLADAIGFVGKNASIQFSNALNPLNHDKTLNDEKKYTLLHALDHEDRMVFFTNYMKQFGLRPACIMTPDVVHVNLHQVVDDAQIEADESFKTSKLALRDGTLTKDELKAIIKESSEAEAKQAEIRAIAQARLKEMEAQDV